MEEGTETAELKPSYWHMFKAKLVEYKRVLLVTKKPTAFEFKTIVKVSALGITLIGFIGFLIYLIKELILA